MGSYTLIGTEFLSGTIKKWGDNGGGCKDVNVISTTELYVESWLCVIHFAIITNKHECLLEMILHPGFLLKLPTLRMAPLRSGISCCKHPGFNVPSVALKPK